MQVILLKSRIFLPSYRLKSNRRKPRFQTASLLR